MAVTSLDELVETVRRWSGGGIDAAFEEAVRDAVRFCEAELDRRLRVPEMVKRVSFSTTGRWDDLPADFLAMKALFRVDARGRERLLRAVTDAAAPGWREVRGDPIYYALSGLQISLVPRVDGVSYPLRMIYWSRVPSLSGHTPCTAVLQRYPDLYVFGSLVGLESYLVSDERIAVWRQQFEAALASANQAGAMRVAALA